MRSRRGAASLRWLAFAASFGLAWVGCGADEIPTDPPPGARLIDMAVTQTQNADSIASTGTVTFSVRLRNNGPGEATDVIGADTLSSGLTYVSHSIVGKGVYDPATRLWTIGTLAENEQVTLHITAQANGAGVNNSVQTNSAGATTSGTAVFDSLPSNNIAVAAVRVADPGAPPPPPASVVFSSDWSTATGTVAAATTDNGRWDKGACSTSADVISVVPGGPLGWSLTPNVLRLRQLGSGPCGMIQKQNAVPQSTSHWGRFYVRNDEHGTRNDHTMAYNNIHDGMGMQAVPFARHALSDVPVGQWKASIINRVVYPYNRWYVTLQAGVWYRYEYHMEYITPTTYRIWPRIYNLAGTLLFDADDFRTENGTRDLNLLQWYDVGGANRTIPLGVLNTETSDPVVARHIGLGNEGNANATNTGGYWYYARFALGTAGWIGQ